MEWVIERVVEAGINEGNLPPVDKAARIGSLSNSGRNIVTDGRSTYATSRNKASVK